MGLLQFKQDNNSQTQLIYLRMINIALNQQAKLLRPSGMIVKYKYSKSHIGMQYKKELDRSKKCIQLMTQFQRPFNSIEFLKMSQQYGVTQANKISLFLSREDLNFRDSINSAADGDFVQLQTEEGFQKFKYNILRASNIQDTELHSLGLHEGKCVDKFLRIAEHLEPVTPPKFNRFLLSFICNYAANYEEISDSNFYKIANHLAARSYTCPKIIQHFQNLQFDRAKAEAVFNQGTSQQISNSFDDLSNLLQCLLNLQAHYPQFHANERARSEIIATFFNFLENPKNLETILTLNPKSIFIDGLFKENKKKYFGIIERMLSPFHYPAIRMHDNLFLIMFDKLLMFSDVFDEQIIKNFLHQYSKCLQVLVHQENQVKISGGAAIMLCQKYAYFSKEFFQQIFQLYLKPAFKLKPLYLPLNNRKNHSNFKNLLIMRIYQIGTMISLSLGKDPGLETLLTEAFSQKLERILNKKSGEGYSNVDSLFICYNYEDFKNVKMTKDELKNLNNFNRYEEFIFTQEMIAPFQEVTSRIEKELNVKLKTPILQNYSFPITMRLNPGARLKILIWITIYANRFASTLEFFNFYNRFIEKNEALNKLIEENILYPGLLQGIALLNSIPKANIHSDYISLPQKFLESYIATTRQALQKEEVSHKNVKELEPIHYMWHNNIEFLSEPLRMRPWVYKPDLTLQKDIYYKTEFYNYLMKNEQLIKKLSEQLKIIKHKSNLQNIYAFSPSSEFPYVTGFSILKDKKKYFLMFIDPPEKQRFEKLLKGIKEKKQPNVSEGERNINILNFRELSLSFYQQKNTIVLLSNEEDIKKFITSISK